MPLWLSEKLTGPRNRRGQWYPSYPPAVLGKDRSRGYLWRAFALEGPGSGKERFGRLTDVPGSEYLR